ncbi:hypothetical protein [Pandoraea commovens]|uniref:Flagellar FliJ protein n=2 Tax=Pandoraea commovens TaxID=2508289 RepID=A0ABY5QHY6_9BURK|nr:hypothetical protein [Pandoraea commovens]UVA80397.1 hypothetical protein NTU39_05065 [Pandoraea commovens]
MARTSRELKDREGIAALAMLAQRREAGLRAALARLMLAAREAADNVVTCERACDVQRDVWQRALSRGGVYGPREAAGAARLVEEERASLVDAKARHSKAIDIAQQAEAHVREQRERLQSNSRKQEKLRELLEFYRT